MRLFNSLLRTLKATKNPIMKHVFYAIALVLATSGCKPPETQQAVSMVHAVETTVLKKHKMSSRPAIDIISHATFIMNWDGTIIYLDPVGGAVAFEGKPAPDLVLVTDIHYDHTDAETLQAVLGKSLLVAPQAVATKIGPEFTPQIMANGETKTVSGFEITAIPMYNLTADRLKFHDKGRGNGYIIEKDGYRVYVSGDTEDIPEMRALKNIDLAFVCMNLPYTMVEAQAASAVLEFEPKEVIPFHYRGTDGKLDIAKFKSIVQIANPSIKVILMDWYPE
jgi:L-ascorbate metabolism protein UlaG (beta-lactamase superfamily)